LKARKRVSRVEVDTTDLLHIRLLSIGALGPTNTAEESALVLRILIDALIRKRHLLLQVACVDIRPLLDTTWDEHPA
jgi:hypothetical protein